MIKSNIGGYELLQNDPTPEELERMWDFYNKDLRLWENGLRDNSAKPQPDDNVKYEFVFNEDVNEKKTFVTKIKGGTEVWTAVFNGWQSFYRHVELIRCGENILIYGGETMALINDETGEIISHIKWHEYVNGILEEVLDIGTLQKVICTEEKIIVLSTLRSVLYVTSYDFSGNLLSNVKNEEVSSNSGVAGSMMSVNNVVILGDKLIVQVTDMMFYGSGVDAYVESNEMLLKIEADGSVSNTFFYETDDEMYFIKDMIEYNGKVYMSANAVPKIDDFRYGNNSKLEVAHILNQMYDNFNKSPEDWSSVGPSHVYRSEILLQAAKDNFTAVLLVCDSEGTPTQFYSAKESIGGELVVNDAGELVWEVGKVIDAIGSPIPSSYALEVNCQSYLYSFNAHGWLLEQVKTDKI